MKKSLVIVSMILVFILLAGCGNAGSLSAVKSKGELVVATNAEFPPFEYMEGGNIVGIDMDIAKAIADKLGVKLKIDNMNFDAVLAAVPSGKADLGIAALSSDPDRLKVMDFSDSYFNSAVMIIVKSGNDGIKGKKDLPGKKVGVQTGTIADSIATEMKDVEVVRMNKDADSIQDLLNGKLDAVLIDQYPAKVFVAQNKDKLILLDEKLSDDKYAIAAKKGNTEILKAVNEVIKQLKDSGEYDRILNKYIMAK